MRVIIGSAVGCLPLIWASCRQRRPFALIGHSRAQAGAALASGFIELSYHDVGRFVRAIDERVGSASDHEVVPGPHDLCYRVYAEYGVTKGLFSTSVAERAECFHNKRLFRQKLLAIAPEYVPWFCPGNEFEVAAGGPFPMLYKPDHAGGGRGIVYIADRAQLEAFSQARPKGNDVGIYEAVFSGQLFSVSLWVNRGKVVAYYAERELIDDVHFRVNSSLTSNELQAVVADLGIPNVLADIISCVGLMDGFCHTQLLIAASGDWKIVECMLRLPGDLYMYNAETFGGFPYTDMYLKSFQAGQLDLSSGIGRAVFPDDSIYGRAMVRRNEAIDRGVEPFCSFNSHVEDISESYRVVFFRVPASRVFASGCTRKKGVTDSGILFGTVRLVS